MEYTMTIEKMEAVIAPNTFTAIGDAVNSFFQGLYDGLSNGIIF